MSVTSAALLALKLAARESCGGRAHIANTVLTISSYSWLVMPVTSAALLALKLAAKESCRAAVQAYT
jgi:hypothetical protein